jgi:uncharacterized membrane protein SpoIIM required for sporulation
LISQITEVAFATRRRSDWDRLDVLCGRVGVRGLATLDSAEIVALPALYSNACADLAAARAARYSAPLIDYLQTLTGAAHTIVYGSQSQRPRGEGRGSRLRAALDAFPRAVRARWRPIALAAVLFFVPFVAGALATLAHPDFAMQVVPGPTLQELTEAYAKGFAGGRSAGASTAMAGFYVNNNVGIALRCFALGIFGGVGSVFFLLENGLITGAILGYVTSQGAGENIFTFVVGHSSLELGAIVLAGGAGMSLGWSVVAPGELTRTASLQAAAREIVVIVFGAAVMLLMAAGLEAYWSSSSMPAPVKLTVGASLAVATVLYLALVGRGRDARAGAKGGRG